METLTNKEIKWIRSLERKKEREQSGCFLAEGPKLVGELLSVFRCRLLLVSSEAYFSMFSQQVSPEVLRRVSGGLLERASLLRTPQGVLGVFEHPQPMLFSSDILSERLCLALDGVQDPGNVGTILRVADWMGITEVFCSPDTADVFSPKVVQASMGAIARVKTGVFPLPELIKSLPAGVPVYGTTLEGENIYRQKLSQYGLIVMGNEGKGISPELRPLLTHQLYFPPYPEGRPTSESLNVGVATAIICAEFRRRNI